MPLSRVDGEEKFLREVYKPEHACWAPDTVPIRLAGAGRKRTLPEKRGVIDSGEHAGLPAPESKFASEEGGRPAAAPPASLDVSSATLIENSRPVEAGDDGTDYIRRAQAAGGCPTAPAAPVAPRRGAGIGIRRGGSLALVLALFGCFCVPGGDCMPVTRIQASTARGPCEFGVRSGSSAVFPSLFLISVRGGPTPAAAWNMTPQNRARCSGEACAALTIDFW